MIWFERALMLAGISVIVGGVGWFLWSGQQHIQDAAEKERHSCISNGGQPISSGCYWQENERVIPWMFQ